VLERGEKALGAWISGEPGGVSGSHRARPPQKSLRSPLEAADCPSDAFLVKHQSRIRAEQPYQRRGKARERPLWLLHELRNVDAHRVLGTILPTVAVPMLP